MKTNRFTLVGVIALVAIIGFTFAACNKGGSASGVSAGGGKVKTNPESDFEARAIDGGKGVEITKYVGDKWEVGIPEKIRGLPVTSIGYGAFSEKSLISITIPNSVTTIRDIAFGGNQLTSVTIPNSVTKIGDHAFAFNQLTNVTIPNSVTSLSGFGFNQLTSITIPNSVTEIGIMAFFKNQLTSITIPNSVTKIGDEAFQDNQLTSVTIPNSVTEIGITAFHGNQLTSVTIGANVMTEITSFDASYFKRIYDNNGKAAGTYTRPNAESTAWTKQ